jgi:filamentous hemagglutinin family protein
MKKIIAATNSRGFLPGKLAPRPMLRPGFRTALVGGIVMGMGLAQANPTGGTVAAGSATISGEGTAKMTVTQHSRTAIIDWSSFSVGAGDVLTFVQPAGAGLVLNRVTHGGASVIDGKVKGNSQVQLVNGNCIVIGKGADIEAGAITASTRSITSADLSGTELQFRGASPARVQNFGTMLATKGDLVLIGQSVDNEGSLSAPNGVAGLAAAQSVQTAQSGPQHIFVSATPGVKVAGGAVGVNNKGSIVAMATELRAANGDRYTLAINNSGTIRAAKAGGQGGQNYLISDGGVIVNTGSVIASTAAAGGAGGAVQIRTSTTKGTVVNHGQVLAQGGPGGVGGTVDLCGAKLDFKGGVNLTAAGGTTGKLLLDPETITIDTNVNANGVVTTTGTVTTYQPAQNYTGSELYYETLQTQLALANVVVDGITNVTVSSDLNTLTPPGINWGDTAASTSGAETASSLTLETTGKGGTIVIDAPIVGHESPISSGTSTPTGTSTLPKATLIINDEGNGYVTTGTGGVIDVDNFTLEAGFWQQILTSSTPTAAQLKAQPGLLTSMPNFVVGNDFQLDGTSCTFERFYGGNGLLPTTRAPGNSPYLVSDIYGMEGIGSPSGILLAGHYELTNDILADTSEWNGGDGIDGGAGWIPIGENGPTVKPFAGTFDGEGYAVQYYLYRPNDDLAGLFGEVSGTVENLSAVNIDFQNVAIGGILAGRVLTHGVINNCIASSGSGVTPPGPSAPADGTTANQSELPSASLGVSSANGGLVGQVMAGGLVEDSQSYTAFTLLGSSGVFGYTGIGGLVGINQGIITNCDSFEAGATTNSVEATGTSTASAAEEESINIGGLVGLNMGTINGGQSEGVIDPVSSGTSTQASATAASIISGSGNFNIGGFVGANYGTIDTAVKVGRTTATWQAFTDVSIYVVSGTTTSPDVYGGTGSYYMGGFVGVNYGHIADGYAAQTISGADSLIDNSGAPVAVFTTTTVTSTGTSTGTTTLYGGELIVANNLQGAGANGSSGTGALGNIAVGGFAGGNFGTITNSGSEDLLEVGSNIQGVGTVSVRSRTGTTTEPNPAVFSNPLELDSVFVGGFVGLNGARSSLTNSFSDENSNLAIQLTLDPTQSTQTAPVLAASGNTLSLAYTGTSTALVTSTGTIGLPEGASGAAPTGYYITGGFAGGNYGTISTSYGVSDVTVSGATAQSDSFYTGGFAGVNSGGISNVFALGNVVSTATVAGNSDETGVVGGLVGQINAGGASDSFETGSVTGGTTRGGLVGVRAAGAVTGSFWDSDSNDPGIISDGPDGYSAGGTPATNLQLDISTATEATSIYHTAHWNFTTIWLAPASAGPPTLKLVPGP